MKALASIELESNTQVYCLYYKNKNLANIIETNDIRDLGYHKDFPANLKVGERGTCDNGRTDVMRIK